MKVKTATLLSAKPKYSRVWVQNTVESFNDVQLGYAAIDRENPTSVFYTTP